jgi:hypothetical protein
MRYFPVRAYGCSVQVQCLLFLAEFLQHRDFFPLSNHVGPLNAAFSRVVKNPVLRHRQSGTVAMVRKPYLDLLSV